MVSEKRKVFTQSLFTWIARLIILLLCNLFKVYKNKRVTKLWTENRKKLIELTFCNGKAKQNYFSNF